jgi:hypothetical protein
LNLSPRGKQEVSPGWVYFIRGEKTHLVKIGSTRKDPSVRVKECQTGSPDVLDLVGVIYTATPRALERYLHEEFADLRKHGEWFSEEILIPLVSRMQACA